MIMNDPGPAIFTTDPGDEYRINFIVKGADEVSSGQLLMTMRCFEEAKLRGTVVWLGEHQHLWPEWQAIAETKGGNLFSGHLTDLMMQESLKRFGSADYLCEVCIGASLKMGGGRTDIELSMMLATRSLPIITHAFKSSCARDAFFDLQASEERTGNIELAEIALLQGRNALARRLDNIADRQLQANVHIFKIGSTC
jgi:hypothetical protein